MPEMELQKMSKLYVVMKSEVEIYEGAFERELIGIYTDKEVAIATAYNIAHAKEKELNKLNCKVSQADTDMDLDECQDAVYMAWCGLDEWRDLVVQVIETKFVS